MSTEDKEGWRAETGEEAGGHTQTWFGWLRELGTVEVAPEEAATSTRGEGADVGVSGEGRGELVAGVEEEPGLEFAGEVQPVTPGQWLLMAAWVVVGLLGAALPLYVCLVVLMMFAAAVALMAMEPTWWQDMRALEGSAKLWRMVFSAALVCLPLWTFEALLTRKMARIAAGGLLYLVACALFYAAGGKLPMFVFASVGPAIFFGVGLALPWAVSGWLWDRGAMLWRWLERHAFWAGAATVMGGAAAAAVVSGWLLVWAVASADAQARGAMSGAPSGAQMDDGLVDLSLDGATRILSAWAPEPIVPREPDARFDACVQTLYAQRDPRSWREEGILFLRRSGVAYGAEEDLAQTAIIRVCKAHEKNPKEKLGPYYIRSIKNLSKTNWKKNRYEACPMIELSEPSWDPYITSFIHFNNAICKIEDDHKKVLELYAKGLDYEEISVFLGISEVAARQRKSRAMKRLSELMEYDTTVEPD